MEASTETKLIDEERLRRFSIHGLEGASEDSVAVKQTLQEVLNTFKSPGVSSAHAAAAVNALCALIDRLRSSERLHVSSECLSEEFQAELFSAYLQRSDNLNAKPARRLLTTATNLALSSSDGFLQKLRSDILTDCLDALVGSSLIISVRASLQVLDHFFDKLLMTAYDILLMDSDVHSFSKTKLGAAQTQHSVKNLQDAATQFTLQVFAWVRFPDCAPVISRFLPRFFDSLDSYFSQSLTKGDGGDNHWLPSVKLALERDPDLLEKFEQHVIPGLLSLKSTNLRHFKESDSFRNVLSGNYGRIEDADLQICLLVAKLSDRLDRNDYISGERAYCESP